MNIPALIIFLCWVVFILVWVISAFNTKRYARRNYGSWGLRILIVAAFFVLLQFQSVRLYFLGLEADVSNPAVQWLGAILCVLGVSFAIWARFNLGRNWGMPMSLKQDAELVTSGPYAYVRHPIYTGMMLIMLGSTLVSIWWVVALVCFSVYFFYSAKTEEGIMLKEFPDTYPDYMKRTKMLIPFLF